MQWQQTIDTLTAAYPDLLGAARVIGEGHLSVVVDRGDGSVVKMIHRYSSTDHTQIARNKALHQWNVLSCLQNFPQHNLRVPIPLGPIVWLEQGPFCAAIRMTKIETTPADVEKAGGPYLN